MCVYVCVCCVHINVSKTVSAYQFLVFVILLISWVLFSQHCYSWKTLRLQLQTDKNISNHCVGLKHDNLPDLLKLINGNWMDTKLKKRHHAVFFPTSFFWVMQGSLLTLLRRKRSASSTSFNDWCNYTVSPLTHLYSFFNVLPRITTANKSNTSSFFISYFFTLTAK